MVWFGFLGGLAEKYVAPVSSFNTYKSLAKVEVDTIKKISIRILCMITPNIYNSGQDTNSSVKKKPPEGGFFVYGLNRLAAA